MVRGQRDQNLDKLERRKDKANNQRVDGSKYRQRRRKLQGSRRDSQRDRNRKKRQCKNQQ